MNWLVNAWYQKRAWLWIFFPLALIYRLVVARRKKSYLTGKKATFKATVPVIIIGNITIGGTGKTPFTIRLVNILKEHGWHPGVVSRGYGGKANYPLMLDSNSKPKQAGDEPVLIQRESKCPVVVDPNRPAAVKLLLKKHPETDVIVSDDGLQHYALARDVEIVLIDERGFGNQHCLPQGPLREPLSRLNTVDYLIMNSKKPISLSDVKTGYTMHIKPLAMVNLLTAQQVVVGTTEFAEIFENKTLNAVCGIGNPQRFFDTLEALALNFNTRVFPDHHQFCTKDILFSGDGQIVMTMKDAVKCEGLLTSRHSNYWYLSIDAEIESKLIAELLAKIKQIP